MIADDKQTLERLTAQITASVQQLWEEAGHLTDADALERAVQLWQRLTGKEVMETLCQQAIERREQAEKPVCCGRNLKVHSRQARVITTLLGTVRLRRRYYRCPHCGKSQFPAQRFLGWQGSFSHRVQELVAWECAGLPYREALASLEKLAGITLSVHAAEEIVSRWGEKELTPPAYGARVTDDLVVQIDGTTAHLQEGWKEVKLGAFFCWNRTEPEAKPAEISYVADWESAAEFADTLWGEALARGAPTAGAQAVIGDGAPWVWELAGLLFPQATQILDWYHLSEHLWEAAAVVHGEGSKETKELAKMWEAEVWQGSSPLVVSHLRELVSMGKDDGKNTLRRCAGYLENHQARLRYDLFRAAGWPIGSGVVEGGCKQVVGLRFKRKSTRWSKTGARAVLHLRLDRLNGRWQGRSGHMKQA